MIEQNKSNPVSPANASFAYTMPYKKTGDVQMRLEETSEQLHERLWPEVSRSFLEVKRNSLIETETSYTTDVSSVLGIENAIAIFTSTCKHETPYKIIVGVREGLTDTKVNGNVVTKLKPLEKPLTETQKKAIYDYAPF